MISKKDKLMDSFVKDFNDTTNGVLDKVFSNEYIATFIIVVLVMYATLAAPRLPLSAANVFTNPWFRFGVLAFAAWMFSKNPAISILIAVGWYISNVYILSNASKFVAQHGIMNPEYLKLVAGTPVMGLKSQDQVQGDASLMKNEWQAKTASGFVTVPAPQATLSSMGGPTTVANQSIDSIPSGTPANSPTMMEQAHPMSNQPGGLLSSSGPGSNMPAAYVPAGVMNSAPAPH